MAQFYSDLFSWSVVGFASGAVFLASVEVQPIQPEEAGNPILVASAETERTMVTSDITDAGLILRVAAAEVAAAEPARAPLPQIIQDADLLEVSFTATGDDFGLPAVSGAPRGVVTGRSVNLRAGPGTGFEIVSRAGQNDELVVTGETDGVWVQVLAPISEREAWIHGKYFRAPDGA